MDKNKVKFGLKNVHYAMATINAEDNTAEYESPKKWPGAVSLSMEPQGDSVVFHADDGVYFSTSTNNGYEGDLEMALVPDEFRIEALGDVKDKNGVILENAGAISKPFALLFEFQGDAAARRHVFFNCTASRPNVASQTKGDTIEVQTETTTITAAPIHIAGVDLDVPKASVNKTDSPYASWFESVYTPEAAEAISLHSGSGPLTALPNDTTEKKVNKNV